MYRVRRIKAQVAVVSEYPNSMIFDEFWQSLYSELTKYEKYTKQVRISMKQLDFEETHDPKHLKIKGRYFKLKGDAKHKSMN